MYYLAALVTLSTVYRLSEDGQAWIMERYVIQSVSSARARCSFEMKCLYICVRVLYVCMREKEKEG